MEQQPFFFHSITILEAELKKLNEEEDRDLVKMQEIEGAINYLKKFPLPDITVPNLNYRGFFS